MRTSRSSTDLPSPSVPAGIPARNRGSRQSGRCPADRKVRAVWLSGFSSAQRRHRVARAGSAASTDRPRGMPMSARINRRRLLAAALAAPAAATLLPAAARAADDTSGADGAYPSPEHPLKLHLPAPSGPYPVGTTTLHLVDRSRPDPYVTSQPYRELMVNLTYPAAGTDGYDRSGWLTAGWAANQFEVMQGMTPGSSPDLVDWAGTKAYAYADAPVGRLPGGLPVLVYSLGHWVSHSINRCATEDLASRGYVVVAFDPTFETPVEFPGGRMVPTNAAAYPPTQDFDSPEFLAWVRDLYAGRLADARFVLDRLAVLNSGGNPDEERRPLPPGLPGSLDLTRVGAFSGGVAGGVISLQLMADDSRVGAAFTGDQR